MRPHRILLLLLSVALLAPAAAFAQASGAGDRPRPRAWHEVERGLYVTGTFGDTILLSPPVSSGKGPTVTGLTMGVAIGYDLARIVRLEVFFTGAEMVAPSSYLGMGSIKDPGGDFSTLLGGATLRVAYASFADVQHIDRLFLDVHAGGGIMLSRPSTVFGKSAPMLLGGLGLRYYTRMRHFSAGLDVDGFFGLGLGTIGLYPHFTIAYTF